MTKEAGLEQVESTSEVSTPTLNMKNGPPQPIECPDVATFLAIKDVAAYFHNPLEVYPYICLVNQKGICLFVKAISCRASPISERGGLICGLKDTGGNLDEHQTLSLAAQGRASVDKYLRTSTMMLIVINLWLTSEGYFWTEDDSSNHYTLVVAVRPSVQATWDLQIYDPEGKDALHPRVHRKSSEVVRKILARALPELTFLNIHYKTIAPVSTLYRHKGNPVCYMGPCADMRLMVNLWAQSGKKASSGLDFMDLDILDMSKLGHPILRLLSEPHITPVPKRSLKHTFFTGSIPDDENCVSPARVSITLLEFNELVQQEIARVSRWTHLKAPPKRPIDLDSDSEQDVKLEASWKQSFERGHRRPATNIRGLSS